MFGGSFGVGGTNFGWKLTEIQWLTKKSFFSFLTFPLKYIGMVRCRHGGWSYLAQWNYIVFSSPITSVVAVISNLRLILK